MIYQKRFEESTYLVSYGRPRGLLSSHMAEAELMVEGVELKHIRTRKR